MRRGTSHRIVKLVVSVIFLCACTVRNLIFRFGRRKARCVVLYYHAVTKTERIKFAHQMDLLLRLGKPIAADLSSVPQTQGNFVAVTFDDGLESVVENALPELEQRKIPCAIFIVPESLGRPPIWMNSSQTNGRVMSLEQMRNLNPLLVTVGSHSLTHPNLPRLDPQAARQEICHSRSRLRNLLGREIDLFSFPYGAFNQSLIENCREAGYKRAFTTQPTLAFNRSEEFASGRVAVEPGDSDLEFRLKVMGAYRWLPAAFALKRRLKSLFFNRQTVKAGSTRALNKSGDFESRSI